MADESEDLSPAELDAQIGPEAEAAAWRGPAQADPYADLPAVDDISQLTPEQQALVRQTGGALMGEQPATAPEQQALYDVAGVARAVNGNNLVQAPAEEPILPAAQYPASSTMDLPGGPSVAVTPAGQQPVEQQVAPPSTVQAQSPREQLAQTITPTPEQGQAALQKAIYPVQQYIADSEAKKQADAELGSYIDQEKNRQEQVARQIAAMDEADKNYVRARSFGEVMKNGSFGNRILASLAVLMGGVAQGLTGAAKNPVLDYIDSEADRQAQRDKLTFEQRLQLRGQLLESAKNVIGAAQNRYQNQHTQDQLNLEYNKLNEEFMKNLQKMQNGYASKAAAVGLAQIQSKTGIPIRAGTEQEHQRIQAQNTFIDQVLAGLAASGDNKKYQEAVDKLIVFPNGQKEIATGDMAGVNKYKETTSDNLTAIKLFEDMKLLAEKGNAFNPADREFMASTGKLLAGKLRLSVLGPGTMTEDEYNRLINLIGNPQKIFALSEVERTKVNAMLNVLEADIAQKAQTYLQKSFPISDRSRVIQSYISRGMSPRDAATKADVFFKGQRSGR